jgi:hypothetical protein
MISGILYIYSHFYRYIHIYIHIHIYTYIYILRYGLKNVHAIASPNARPRSPKRAEDAAFDFGWGLFLAHLLLINDYTDYLHLCVYIIYM